MDIIQMKINIKILLLILFSNTGFSQQKSLSELTKEIQIQKNIDKVNYIILSRTISTLTINEKEENDEANWESHYKLLVIIEKNKKTVVEEYQDGIKSNIFEINDSKIFNFLKHNFPSINAEKLNEFEYAKDGSKVYIGKSNSGEMKIDVFLNQSIYNNTFNDFLLEFSSNSKLKLVKLMSLIKNKLEPYYKNHPFYVNPIGNH